MTDRVSHLVVTLKTDTRVDDVKDIIALIRQIGAVADVATGPVLAGVEAIERHRHRNELRDHIANAVDAVLFPEEQQ